MNNFFDLIDVALDKLKTHGLHKEKFDVVLVYPAVGGNAIEFKRAVVLVYGEEKFQEGDYANLLLKRVELL